MSVSARRSLILAQSHEKEIHMALPQGFYVGPKAWDTAPSKRYVENPPDDWEDCDQCGCIHPPNFTGDCRDDINRWPSEECIAALTGVR